MALYNISAGTRGYAFATSNGQQQTTNSRSFPGSGFNQNEITWIQNLGPYVGLHAMDISVKLYPCSKLCYLKKTV